MMHFAVSVARNQEAPKEIVLVESDSSSNKSALENKERSSFSFKAKNVSTLEPTSVRPELTFLILHDDGVARVQFK